jgi:ribonuclease HI
MKLDFGKYADTDIADVPRGYLEWLRDRNKTILSMITVELQRRDERGDAADDELGLLTRPPLPFTGQCEGSVTVICDGGCVPVNPGGYGLWAFLAYAGDVSGARGKSRPAPLDSRRGCFGKGDGVTNNVAEYHGMIESLRWIQRHAKTADVELRCDSQLVVKQINGEYGCSADHLRPLYDRMRGLKSGLRNVRVRWVPREETYVADALVQVAYQEAKRSEAA